MIDIKHLQAIEDIVESHDISGLMLAISQVMSERADVIRERNQYMSDKRMADLLDGYSAGFLEASIKESKVPFIKQVTGE